LPRASYACRTDLLAPFAVHETNGQHNLKLRVSVCPCFGHGHNMLRFWGSTSFDVINTAGHERF
jgi:hypothetical protein